MNTDDKLYAKIPKDKTVSMRTNDYKSVIDRIVSSDCVVSSSLHGIILAEAYGIPAVFFQDREDALNFKYADWYESTGRLMPKPETDVFRAIEVAMKKREIPQLDKMQNALLQSFPYDLWMG